VGDRWACLIVDRASRFVVAHATGRRDEDLAARAVGLARARTGGRPLAWCSDGWRPYPTAITRAYRRPVHTGRRGRPPLRVPAGVALTQTVKHRDRRGRLVRVETRATVGAPVPRPAPVHVERLNGALRDRLAALTRKTHAFAKTAATWDALVGLALFEHNWLRPHPALRRPTAAPGRRYERRTPAMALGLADHPWPWVAFLATPIPVRR
jgi:IS1 family transposase